MTLQQHRQVPPSQACKQLCMLLPRPSNKPLYTTHTNYSPGSKAFKMASWGGRKQTPRGAGNPENKTQKTLEVFNHLWPPTNVSQSLVLGPPTLALHPMLSKHRSQLHKPLGPPPHPQTWRIWTLREDESFLFKTNSGFRCIHILRNTDSRHTNQIRRTLLKFF